MWQATFALSSADAQGAGHPGAGLWWFSFSHTRQGGVCRLCSAAQEE